MDGCRSTAVLLSFKVFVFQSRRELGSRHGSSGGRWSQLIRRPVSWRPAAARCCCHWACAPRSHCGSHVAQPGGSTGPVQHLHASDKPTERRRPGSGTGPRKSTQKSSRLPSISTFSVSRTSLCTGYLLGIQAQPCPTEKPRSSLPSPSSVNLQTQAAPLRGPLINKLYDLFRSRPRRCGQSWSSQSRTRNSMSFQTRPNLTTPQDHISRPEGRHANMGVR